MEDEEDEEETCGGPTYGCPRCGALYDNFRGIRQHLRKSMRCRSVFEDLDKTKAVQKQCREAAKQNCRPARTSSFRGRERGGSLRLLPSSDGSAGLPEPAVSEPEVAAVEDPSGSGEAESRAGSPPRRRKVTSSAGGVGGRIVAASGRPMGVVVAEERRCWRLADGRAARKAAEGRKWHWEPVPVEDTSCVDCSAVTGAATTDGESTAPPSRTQSSFSSRSPASFQAWSPMMSAAASPLLLPEPSVPLPEPNLGEPKSQLRPEDEEFVDVGQAACGVGAEIVGSDGKSWGLVVAEERHCWRLAAGRVAKKAMEGKKWRWAALAPVAVRAPPPSSPSLLAVREDSLYPQALVVRACDWLPLQSALCAMWTCKDWAAALTHRVPIELPPPQADALLQFCLLEVLLRFDDDKLPFPISALYSEMRAVARRSYASSAVLERLEELVFRNLGPSRKEQQEQFLKHRRPHHVAWSVELKNSGFKTLERLAKHFDGERLIEIFHQRWRKRIHHTPNTRTCFEWVLTKVNRRHPLFLEHARWRSEVAEPAVAEAALEAADGDR